ncbi:hypothetical protein CSKR_109395 [Clonorchis sinensis]|uniref:Uncharacterized protein n=1 Tax=Clonorchis sinensis TaxID=79923 RepID=A0A3R7JLW2_CLOSI|nr:hypothetical protein CSKR_109395 [Clonorchis sinensis]
MGNTDGFGSSLGSSSSASLYVGVAQVSPVTSDYQRPPSSSTLSMLGKVPSNPPFPLPLSHNSSPPDWYSANSISETHCHLVVEREPMGFAALAAAALMGVRSPLTPIPSPLGLAYPYMLGNFHRLGYQLLCVITHLSPVQHHAAVTISLTVTPSTWQWITLQHSIDSTRNKPVSLESYVTLTTSETLHSGKLVLQCWSLLSLSSSAGNLSIITVSSHGGRRRGQTLSKAI